MRLLFSFVLLASLCCSAWADTSSSSPDAFQKVEVGDGYTKYEYPPPTEEQSYHPVQALHGLGAIFVAIGEPILFRPAAWIKEGLSQTHGKVALAAIPACAIAGMIEGVFYSVFDVVVGTGDLLSGGYFRLSSQAGIFDYFSDERSQPVDSSMQGWD